MSLKKKFNTKILESLQEELELKSKMAVPKLKKVVINTGFGSKRENKVYVQESYNDIMALSGQKPLERKAKQAISNFKLRQGNLIGYKVTLRGTRMWYFTEKFVSIVLPRVKDFNGVSKKSFDRSGNYNIGIEDHSVFPEIDANKITYLKPLQVTFVTSSKDDYYGYKLLKSIGIPFRD